MQHLRTLSIVLPIFASLLPSGLRAERVYIDISGATFRPYPMAIPRVRSEAGVPGGERMAGQLTERIRYDLEVTGLFQVLDPRSFLASPKEGITASTIRFSDWANVGAEGLLKGRLVLDETGGIRFEARLFNVTTESESARFTYPVDPEKARYAAHALANDLVRHFTRERGIFDTKIAFIRKIRGRKELWISDWDGFAPRRIVGGELNLLPAWHPKGDRLLFTSYRDGDPDLYETTLDGVVRTVVGGDAMYTGGAYSPDGSKIAFTRTVDGNAEIYVVHADGTGLKRLTNAYGVDTSPTWSPDGRRIAFVSSRHGNPHIFVMNADGSDQRRLTFQGNYNQTPDWSPRGDVIAFTARDERNVFDLFTVNVETGEIHRLTQDTGNNEEPSFSPNGRHIVFTSTRTGRSEIWIMNADGTNQRKLKLPPGAYFTPAWGPWPSKSSESASAEP
ncbi:MAG: Tol-Pal system beta propeller repeat protein TolB [Deltaproteobacteria bacterium]|nr:MAG: Tol-Pal system beta propeller repeat protein TolB [Deltaproteobacteria bacterium]